MVNLKLAEKLVLILEKYFISRNNFKLWGESYDLIYLMPEYMQATWSKSTLLISSSKFNQQSYREIIFDLFKQFDSNLHDFENSMISKINILNSHDPFVKSMKFIAQTNDKVRIFHSLPYSGDEYGPGIQLKSLILNNLKEGEAHLLRLKSTGMSMPAGIICIDSKYMVKFYTGKGLREIHDRKRKGEINEAKALEDKGEDYLIANEYIATIPFDDIEEVY